MDTYITLDDYKQYGNGVVLNKGNPEAVFRRASRCIDTLTHNRIVGRGFDKLTAYQQETVKDVCSQVADFYTENADFVDTVLSGYSINGVSVQYGMNANVCNINGVLLRHSTYGQLMSTGLCYGGITR